MGERLEETILDFRMRNADFHILDLGFGIAEKK